MRRLHFVVGIASFIAFLLTGQYMDRWLGHLAGMPDLPRMLYRSAHIYLLFAALLNVVLGLYAVDDASGWRRGVAWAGSLMMLSAPVLLLIGFEPESARGDIARPLARMAIYGCQAGVLLHVIARLPLARGIGSTGGA